MIPLSVPCLNGNESIYVQDCITTNWVSSVGAYVDRFEKVIGEYCGVKSAIATSNGTSALHISLILAGVKRNDLVILPNITFVAPANVIKYLGADPILIDVDPDTWQMNLSLLKEFLDNETVVKDNYCIHKNSGRIIRVIMPVHVLGNMCDMDVLLSLADENVLKVVEDATEALGATYKGKMAGTFGILGCLSFNGNKLITTGGGGMILTNDPVLGQKAKHLTTQAKASSTEYFHDEIGYNYRLVNILAALGVAQMEQLGIFLVRKKEIAMRYRKELSQIIGFSPQSDGNYVVPNYWLFTAKFHSANNLMEFLAKSNIQCRPLWVPMNQLPMFKSDLYITVSNISDQLYKSCLSIPCSACLNDKDQEIVISKINEFYE